MKKFIFFLILIILIAGTVFYFGWIRIPENSYGIFFSSLTGYDKNVLETGNFYFRWQRLIPKNSEIHIINNPIRRRNITINGTLPSGDIYSQILHGNPDFSYSASIAATYSANKGFLMGDDRNIAAFIQTGIDNFFTETDAQIQSLIKNYIEAGFLASSIEDPQPATLERPDIFSAETLQSLISSSIHNVEISELTVTARNLPDINLYRIAAIQYMEIANDKKNFLLELELSAAAHSAEFARRLETLSQYAELLSQFPILLDYFRINPDGDILR